MIKAVFILIILSSAATVYFTIILGSRIDRHTFMCAEICDNKSCSRCLDRGQCKRN